MELFFLTFGIITGLIIGAIEYWILGNLGFHKVKENTAGFWIAIAICWVGGLSLFVAFMECTASNGQISPWYSGGSILGIVLSIVYLLWKLLNPEGRYLLLMKKIEKLNKNINSLYGNYKLTKKQRNAVDILETASQKLKEQASDVLILDSVKIAKTIERSHRKIDIQRELDELEALQYLNR